MPRIIRYYLSISVLCGAGLAEAAMQQQSAEEDALPGHLYVRFEEGRASPSAGKSGIEAFDRRAAALGVTSIEKAFPSLEVVAQHRVLTPETEALRNVYRVQYTSPRLPEDVARSLSGVRGVVYAEPLYRKYVTGALHGPREGFPETPNDTMYGSQTHLERMRLPEAWDVVKGESGSVVIAIVDGGPVWRHEDLQANVWHNPNEIAGNGIDDDNNGFVDDVHGWNFADNKPDPTGVSGSDLEWHGTAVAGSAAAVTDNSKGIAGSSWNAKFMGVNIGCPGRDFLCFPLHGTLYAALNGADVVTASYGGFVSSATEHLVYKAALAEGALVVAAAGNEFQNVDARPIYPGSYTETLSVGGLKKADDTNIYNFGVTVNVFAPSVDIELTSPDGYTRSTGTSFATPLTAGVAALVKTVNPSWGPDRIREQIRLSAANIDAANPGYPPGLLGRGKVDAHAAVTQDPLPAIRVLEWSIVNQDGLLDLDDGDRATMTVTYQNHHGDGAGIVAKMTGGGDHVDWDVQQVSLGDMAYGATATANYTFIVQSTASFWTLQFFPEITAGDLVDMSDVINVKINQRGMATHNTASMQVTVTDEGNIGHTSVRASRHSQGSGIMLTTAAGVLTDALFEGGLLVATSATQVSDCVRGTVSDQAFQHQDFVRAQGSTLEITSPGMRTEQEGRVVLTDADADSPIGVEVLQESFTDDGVANEDFIILRYTVTNTSSGRIGDLHVGLYLDWDIAPFGRDATAFDTERGVGYFLDEEAEPSLVAGTVLLSETPELHYRAIDIMRVVYPGTQDGGFTELDKWESISGGVQNGGVLSGGQMDASQVTAAGPFAIEPNESVVVAFALVGGTSKSDFLQNVDYAKTRWTGLETDVRSASIQADEWELHPPYPNPATFPATLRYSSGASGIVEIAVFDMLGRRVRRLLSETRSRGAHVVTWDGRNEHGTQVPSGLYLVRMLGESGHQKVLRSTPILVVR